MIKNKFILLALSGSFLLSGCVSTPYPQRQTYALHVAMPNPSHHHASDDKIAVMNIGVLPQFASSSFVYRTSVMHFTRDYYNIFFNPPAEQINQIVVDYLRHSKLFGYVGGIGNNIATHYMLSGEVTKLYADYRNSKRPYGVTAIHFILTRSGKRPTVMLDQTYQARVPLVRKDSASLVRAWNRGLAQVLGRLKHKLYGIISD
ncbi:MAG: membrane integrity-associated transporter subunit PqiC [Gammaproteobacteria bacterium]|nr:membrane integrity-associated transporter subunit PqiC [Gammaproteobacteria bacterium]